MIIALVTFPPSKQASGDTGDLLRKTAPRYREIPGLRRKYFIGNESLAGGVYEWDDLDTAEAYFNDDWQRRMSELYAVNPDVQFFNAPCLVDNTIGETIYADT